MTIHSYYELKAAFALFGKPCDALDGVELKKARDTASQYVNIEAVVLASDKARGVCLAPGAVDAALAEIRKRHPDLDAYRASLAAAHLDEATLSAALARDLLVDAVVERVGAETTMVSAAEAEAFYHAHRDRFHLPQRRRARHILITINDAFPENTEQNARRRMAEIERRLIRDPGRFEQQAVKHSECPTALNGGLLGDISRGQLYPALDEALFALDAGKLSGILRSELGLHLLFCAAILPARTPTYAEIADKLMTRLNTERRQREIKRWLAELLQAAATLSMGSEHVV
ncbi:MAG: nitrogen fixation protein NifM [Azoarcus sp.]|jgi:nitrogen fixation protein NifM|nr:nitrogen fixation protein NifM [Azoarcus sp.]